MEQLISDGTWPVGSRIPAEPELVATFGVGRNTIREAARALEYSGMLQPRRGDGTYVRSRNAFAAAMTRSASAHALELLQVRRALEAEAAAAAATAASPRDKKRLRTSLARAEKALAAGDIERYAAADIEFHTDIVVASGNQLLLDIYAGVVEVMHSAHATIAQSSVAGGDHPAGHRDVVSAIEQADPSAARQAVIDYLHEAEAGVRR
ncbi:MAG: FCD domain-containing protein [Propionibacteriales bacterium]|nr:FCD domain-containing protein [Propionibacteriales bacterium]